MTSALGVWATFALGEGSGAVPVVGRAGDDARVLIANRIGPMVHRALRAAGAEGPDDEFATLLRDDARTAAEAALPAYAVLRQVRTVLDGARVPWLLWKGPALAIQVWGDPARRHFSDLDIAVDPAHRAQARAALDRAGWRSRDGLSMAQEQAIFRGTGAVPLVRQDGGIGGPLIELHESFGARLYPAPLRVAEVLARSERVSVGGTDVCTPTGADAILLLAMHATKHGWSQAEEVLSFTHLAQRDPTALRRAIEVAERRGVAQALRLAVRLAERLLSVELGTGIVTAPRGGASRARALESSVEDCLARMEAGDAAWRESHAWTLGWMSRPGDRLNYLMRAALDPTPQEWRRVRLRDPLVGWYPAVRLARLALRALRR